MSTSMMYPYLEVIKLNPVLVRTEFILENHQSNGCPLDGDGCKEPEYRL